MYIMYAYCSICTYTHNKIYRGMTYAVIHIVVIGAAVLGVT